ncbi:AAA domain-containing protein [Trebonia kvetii]|nr:AAA domain-containing protein [Trebonia kvetii]
MSRRAGLVQKAASDWKHALVDLGGRNNLLHYRDLKVGTLDLTGADPEMVRGLLLGKATRVTALFRDRGQAEQVLRRVRTIHNKAKENLEERGLETLSIGCGLATWENKRAAWEPCAPVLLQRAGLHPVGAAQDEFELSVTGEMEVNPTLLHVLRADFGCKVDQAALEARIPDGVIDEPEELLQTYEWIAEQARGIPGFRVDRRIVLANFAYAKLAMVNDLDGAQDELVSHELIAALAGDEQAREAIRGQGPGPGAIPGPDQVPLADEFLVLDADSSQNYAINAVLAGQSLIVKGPPGTGKSQTIANLIASLIARGQKVLFVAEKRAAIDAVTKRLSQQNLGDLVLDLHDGVTSKRAFAQMIGQALTASRNAPRVDNGAELHRVERRREQLNAHVRAVHSLRQPWGLSVYEMRAQLLGLEPARTEIRFRGAAIAALSQAVARQAADDVADYARLGGLTLVTASPWAASPIVSAEEVRQADTVLDEVRRHTLPKTCALLESAASETGLPVPQALSGWAALTGAWTETGAMLSVMTPAIYDLDLQETSEALAPAGRGGFSRLWAALTSSRYRAARARLRSVAAGDRELGDRDLYAAVVSAKSGARTWASLGGQGVPRAPRALPDCRASYEHLLSQLGQLQTWSGQPGLADRPAGDCGRTLDMLDADRATLARLPELHRLRTALEAAGLGEFIAAMGARQASEDFAVRAFRYAWLASILDHLELTDLAVASFAAEAHQAAVRDYDDGDRHHIETTSARVRRAYAENTIRARDQFKDQAALVEHQAGLKRRHLPVRDFVRNAADVLLALKPCWAMSPLVVSQLLPPKPYFDVVIFDEASQITPADAVTSILRGRQLVVAGDDKQLPPSAWFVSDNADDEPEPAAGAEPVPMLAGTGGFESILNALGSVLGFRTLLWHYRSRDERLIAFSNAHFYDRMLTTFPGTGGTHVLRYVPAPWQPGADTNSPAPEVDAAVDLIVEHARERPQESLGVITMGIQHRDRIEGQLRQRLSQDPQLAAELAEFFDESRHERFFVKNLERVQGDERDAIILSIGYGKNARGDLPYRFGPLLTEGGERRLNVAVTRAKNRLTLVSSFSSRDMDPGRSAAEGVKLLRQYLQYVESDGTNLGDQILDKPALNPFEVDVRDTLLRHGLKLTPQYGTSGYWIDFAVQHPVQPGRYVLAIECDGATYHSSPSARDRDRLRQEQLERHGWRFHRIWSTEWFHDKQASTDKAIAAHHEAVRAADNGDLAPRPQPAATKPSTTEQQPAASLKTTYEAALSRLTPAPRQHQGPRPPVLSGQPIDAYSDAELLSLARWITTDDALRTEDELLQEMMRELGFKRRGKNVVARLTTAIRLR